MNVNNKLMLVKQKNMNILHLTLKKQWFDMIASGKKKEEYREIKPYWITRLMIIAQEIDHNEIDELCNDLNNPVRFKNYYELYEFYLIPLRKFGRIVFTNGYHKGAKQITAECSGLEIKEGKPEWGAEPGKKYFVFNLDAINTCNLY